MRFVLRLLVTAAALWAAVSFIEGITYEGGWVGLLGVALVFGVVNATVRPFLKLLTCPLIVVTLGLFIFVLNAIMLLLTSALASALGLAFYVDGFWAALAGAIVVSVVSAVLNIALGDEDRRKKRDER